MSNGLRDALEYHGKSWDELEEDMPHIDKKLRPDLEPIVELMRKTGIKANGDLAWVLFVYCKRHIPNKYNAIKNFRGELVETGDEIRRLLMNKREDCAINQNGVAE